MDIVFSQLNYTIGDIDGNTKKILAVIESFGDKADLIVFSELCITGYYPKDLIDRDGFVAAQDEGLNAVRKATIGKRAGVVVGTLQRNPFSGKPFQNALELVDGGQTVYQYHKQLLPTYGVFDEARHFEAGNQPGLFEWRGSRLGFLICEDAWQTEESPLYMRDPISQMENQALDAVISINASPFNIHKRAARHDIVSSLARRCECPVIYVNQIGGIDELVFDGGSLVSNSAGEVCLEAPLFEEASLQVSLSSLSPAELTALSDLELITKQLILGLKDYCGKTGFTKVILGCSGGIDSAVCTAVAALAMGRENVTAVTMPSQYSSSGSVDDSQTLCDALGVTLIRASIKDTFTTELSAYASAFGNEPSPLAQENLQARIRGQRLMTLSNSTGAMLLSCGNRTETAVGYFTLYGDSAGGLSVIGDLFKTQVYALARHLNENVFGSETVPLSIIDKEPSAELAPDQRDSDALPPYDQLDAYLQLLLEGNLLDEKEISSLQEQASPLSSADRRKVLSLLDKTEYKRRQSAPIIRVSRRAFGADRRIPLSFAFRPFELSGTN